MKSSRDNETQKILLLLKLDSKNLYERLTGRRFEYIEIFSAKRTREHFKEIFHSRYGGAKLESLAKCSLETITALDQFYKEIEEMNWYLHHTEEMPVTVEDTVTRFLKKIENYYDTLQLYLDAELGINQEEQETTETQVSTGSVEKEFFDNLTNNEDSN